MKIWLDMDGTIADLYNQKNWLIHIKASSIKPFEDAKIMINEEAIKLLEELSATHSINIISWTPKKATKSYEYKVKVAKILWLKKNLPRVNFDRIEIRSYGTNKDLYRLLETDILFDDEINNRIKWRGRAYEESKILEVLKEIKGI